MDKIRTWEERTADGRRYQNSEDCKSEEIGDLRAALSARTTPASEVPDLTDAIAAMNRAKALRIWDNDVPHALHVELDVIFKALSSAPSPASDVSAAIAALSDEAILQAFATAVGNENNGARRCEVTPDEVIDFVRYHLKDALAAPIAQVNGEGGNEPY